MDIKTNVDENFPVLNTQQQNSFDCPFIKEIRFENGIKKVKITLFKPIYLVVITFLILEIIEISLSVYFYFQGAIFAAVLLSTVLLPFIIVSLLFPIGINCQIDYNNANFTSRPFPVFPITYSCCETSICLYHISSFYLLKAM